MAKSEATSVADYLNSLPDDRKKALSAVRQVIKKNLPKGFQESISFGMISYEVPLKTFPDTYNGKPLMYVAIASQKNHMALYLMCLYSDAKREKTFRAEFEKAGKKLDMGKSCVRFKKLEDLSLDAIGNAVASTSLDEFIAQYEKAKSKR